MNKLILAVLLLSCMTFAVAEYGRGTPGYYDPWTYYGGYDRYSYWNTYPRRRSYYPISNRAQPRPFTPISRYNSGGRSPYYGDNRRYNSMDEYDY